MMNLLDYTKDYSNPANLTIPGNNCFAGLFYNCANLATLGPDFSLPATTLKESCYFDMFFGTSLTSAPDLPATTLAASCYYGMFANCSSLTSAPALLPATTLADYCYRDMFNGCTSLTSVPALPATTLANFCYAYMFAGCTSLTSVPALPATTLANNCYSHMFVNCFPLKFSESKTSEYKNEFKLGDATNATNALSSMFGGTGGTFTSTPTGGTPYYTSNTVVSAN